LVSASPLPALKALHWCARAEALANVRGPLSLKTRWDEVERLLARALAEDEGFARPLTMMAWAVRNQGRPSGEYLPVVERAYARAGAATPQERYFAVGSAHQLRATADITSTSPRLDGARRQEIESAIEAYEALLLLQPDHYYLVNNLVRVYDLAGRADDIATMVARMADAQPRSLPLNTQAANELIARGNLPAARRYAARAEASLTPESHRADPSLAASARFLRAYLSWLEDDPHETLKLVDASATEEMVNRLPAAGRGLVVNKWISINLALGRLDRALEIAERLHVADGPSSHWLLADVFRARGESDRLRAYLTSVWTDHSNPAPQYLRVRSLVSLGLIDEAERAVERAKRQAPAWAADISEAQLELARGPPRAAHPMLQALRVIPHSLGGYPIAESLADAWEAVGDVPRAIEALERVTEQRPALIFDTYHLWMLSRARLAAQYRRMGREAQARPIEAHLLKLLAVADAGHPLVRELRARN
jgi:tetratricopeptide (TPR) repeat protein